VFPVVGGEDKSLSLKLTIAHLNDTFRNNCSAHKKGTNRFSCGTDEKGHPNERNKDPIPQTSELGKKNAELQEGRPFSVAPVNGETTGGAKKIFHKKWRKSSRKGGGGKKKFTAACPTAGWERSGGKKFRAETLLTKRRKQENPKGHQGFRMKKKVWGCWDLWGAEG